MAVAGRGMPVLEADCSGDMVAHRGKPEPFGLMMEALEKVRGENKVRTAIEQGMSARQAWDTFCIL